MALNFELEISGDADVRAIAAKHGVTITKSTLFGPAGGNPCYVFEAPDEASAAALVDEIYGPEHDANGRKIRESTRFYIYSDKRTP